MMFPVDFSFPKIDKIYLHLLSSTALAITGLMLGLAPQIKTHDALDSKPIVTVNWENQAYGQQFSPQEAANYARAGYEVEILRREVYQEIKTIMNAPPPNIVCDQQSTIDSLKPEIKNIAGRYCNESQAIVKNHNLSINRFNELKSRYDRQDNFYQQVQDILLNLQQ